MNVKATNKVETNRYELELEVSSEEFNEAINTVYKRESKKMNIPGFRKGHAPRAFIEKYYGEEVFYETAIDHLYRPMVMEAVEKSGLQVISIGEFKIDEIGKDKGILCKLNVVTKPEATIEGYKGIEVTRPAVEVTGEDIDREIDRVRERNSRIITVEGRAAENGDIVTIDFDGYVDGKQFDGGKADNYELTLGAGQFIPGFEDQVVGHSIGDEFDVNVTFPEDYHAEELKGKPAVFKIKLHEIKAKELPTVDDEFAKDVSEFDTLDELKADVRGKITAEREEAAGRAFEDILMGKVADGLTGEIPDAMVEAQAQRFVDNFRMQIQSQGLPFDKYLEMTNMDVDSLLEQAKEPAARQVKMDLAVGAIIKAEGLEATDEDVDAEYEKMAKQYGMEAEEIKKYMDAEVIREQVLREKAIRVVVDSAVAVEPVIQAEEPARAPAEEAPAEEKPKAKRTRKKKTAEEPAEASESAPEAAE